MRLPDPAPYPEFVWLMDRATLILTDSGGIQEEAPTLGKPVLVLRDTTERPEALASGAIELVGTDVDRIVERVAMLLEDSTERQRRRAAVNPYGDGHAAGRILRSDRSPRLDGLACLRRPTFDAPKSPFSVPRRYATLPPHQRDVRALLASHTASADPPISHLTCALEGQAVRVAIVHDWFVTYAGSERVVEQLIALYPQADVFSLIEFLSPSDRRMLAGKQVTTSFLQKMPFVRRKYAAYLPLMPLAIEQLNLAGYDLVISSSHCVAKGVLTGPDQLHVSYVHTPMRYAWDAQHEYLNGRGVDRGLRSWAARWMLHKLRIWDHRSAAGVDSFVANSRFIARRIAKVYRRDADVIYPPVDTAAFSPLAKRDDFYLTASRLVPYKRVDVLVEAFARLPDRRLVVVGDGPELGRLRAKATPNVSLVGYQDAAALRDYLQRARAFLFASREDFGIVLVEAQAAARR